MPLKGEILCKGNRHCELLKVLLILKIVRSTNVLKFRSFFSNIHVCTSLRTLPKFQITKSEKINVMNRGEVELMFKLESQLNTKSVSIKKEISKYIIVI